MRKIPQYATDLLACGKCAGDWMFGGNSYQIIPNSIDTSRYIFSQTISAQKRSELGIGSEILIGHVGNFTPAKNHSFLLEIFQKVLFLEPSAKLLLVGGGDNITIIKDKVRSLGISDSVIFTGSRSDVHQLMQAMDVFVFPSLYEGLPVTMIEAQSAGLPCVISDHVSEECIVTESLVTVKRLSDPPSTWAKHVLSRAKLPRTNHIAEIQSVGYEIEIAAKRLEAFYLSKSEA